MNYEYRPPTVDELTPPNGQHLIEGVGSQRHQDIFETFNSALETEEQANMLADIGYIALSPNLVH